MSFIATIITTKGIKETGKKLVKYKRLIKSKSTRILKDMGQLVVAISRKDYLTGPRPKFLGVVSGDLRRSIQEKVKGNTVEIGTNLEYGRVWELGIGRPAKPFLAPAFEDSESEIIKVLEHHMRRAKKEAFGRA